MTIPGKDAQGDGPRHDDPHRGELQRRERGELQPAGPRREPQPAEPPRGESPRGESEALYFFPDRRITAAELRRVLEEGSEQQRAWAVSHLLRYAQWDDIWTYVTREEVREIFPALDLPETLRAAWGRMLKIETPVG